MAKGKNFLKTAGILMIIFGAIAVIFNIVALIAGGILGSVPYDALELDDVVTARGVGELLTIASSIGLGSALLEIVTGILGIKNCNKPENVKICIIFGVIVLVLSLISLICSLIGGSNSILSIIVTIICSIALPILYLIGAFKNKSSIE